MIDKAVSVPREKIGPVFGHLDPSSMAAVSQLLGAFFGLEPSGSGFAAR